MSVEIKNLFKSFSAPVLKGVSLQIASGSIHGLVGENGAGKSTLINILAGFLPRDKGELFVDGEPYNPRSVKNSLAAGFSLAAQELSLIEHLSIAENIHLKNLPGKYGVLSRKKIARCADDLLKLVGLMDVTADVKVAKLSLAQKQLVELAKALATASKILILDEPTAALTGPQADYLHKIIRDLAAEGMSVLYVSHRLQDVLNVCDSVSVLRSGEIQFTKKSSELTTQILIEAMSGQTHVEYKNDQSRKLDEVRLMVSNLTTRDLPNAINFSCHRGEILGIAGLAGAGRSELLAAIYGLVPHLSGSVMLLKGEKKILITSAKSAVENGLGLVAEDRKTQGIFADKSIAMNVTVAGLSLIANSWGKLNNKTENKCAEDLIEFLQVKCKGPQQAINRLSGGNQQKLIIGRWMHCGAQILLLDEPTRGIDAGSKQAIHNHLRNLRDNGASIIAVSSEIEELTSLCDRILVLSERKHVATFSCESWSHDAILKASFSEHTSFRSA